MFAGLGGCNGQRAFQCSFQNSDSKIEDSFPASSFHDIEDRRFLDFPVRIDGHEKVLVSVRINALRNSVCLFGSDTELSQDGEIS